MIGLGSRHGLSVWGHVARLISRGRLKPGFWLLYRIIDIGPANGVVGNESILLLLLGVAIAMDHVRLDKHQMEE